MRPASQTGGWCSRRRSSRAQSRPPPCSQTRTPALVRQPQKEIARRATYSNPSYDFHAALACGGRAHSRLQKVQRRPVRIGKPLDSRLHLLHPRHVDGARVRRVGVDALREASGLWCAYHVAAGEPAGEGPELLLDLDYVLFASGDLHRALVRVHLHVHLVAQRSQIKK